MAGSLTRTMQVASPIQTALQQAVDAGVFPGAVLAIRHGAEGDVFCASAGTLSIDPPGGPVLASTIYDLASLTKPLATVSSIALLIQDGRCDLNDRTDLLLPELQDAPVGAATLRDLLSHSSGLPGWRAFYERLSPNADLPDSQKARSKAAQQVVRLIKNEALVYRVRERSIYSDLGFMLLGIIIERVGGSSLDQFVSERITQPLQAGPLRYLPIDPTGSRQETIAPTEWDEWRNRLVCGEVHDQNAAAMGGVAGHAGLFGTAQSVLAVTGAWLAAYHRRNSIFEANVVREITERQADLGKASWALGWDTPSPPSSSGQYFSSKSFGHLGYTGTSIWIDPEQELEVVLLSNRVHPTSKNEAIKSFRPAIHDLVYREFVKA